MDPNSNQNTTNTSTVPGINPEPVSPPSPPQTYTTQPSQMPANNPVTQVQSTEIPLPTEPLQPFPTIEQDAVMPPQPTTPTIPTQTVAGMTPGMYTPPSVPDMTMSTGGAVPPPVAEQPKNKLSVMRLALLLLAVVLLIALGYFVLMQLSPKTPQVNNPAAIEETGQTPEVVPTELPTLEPTLEPTLVPDATPTASASSTVSPTPVATP